MGKGSGLGQNGGKGGFTPSPAHLARVTMSWLKVELPRSERKGYGEETLELDALMKAPHRDRLATVGLPSIIYVPAADTGSKARSFERELFSESVGLGGRIFNRFSIALDTMRPEDRERYEKLAPLVVLLDPAGVETKRFSGWKTKGKELFTAMGRITSKGFKLDLKRAVKDYRKVLLAIDRHYWLTMELRPELAQLEKHVREHACQNGQRKLGKLKLQLAKLVKARDKALEKEKKLLERLEPHKREKASSAPR